MMPYELIDIVGDFFPPSEILTQLIGLKGDRQHL